jgi:hypothetical protein
MCEFLSWISMPNGELKYISNFELNTREGKKLKKELGYYFYQEIKGHGAIKTYFGIRHGKGMERECTDFSTPDNFPAEIVKKIKSGEFSQIGFSMGLLNDAALAEYEGIKQAAWAEYKKIEQPARTEYEEIKQAAWTEYEKIEQPAWAEYKEIKQAAWTEYKEIKQAAWAEYEGIKQAAWAEYKKIEQPARTEYEKIEQPARTEYEKIEQAVLAEYKKIEQPAWAEYEKTALQQFWKLFAIPSNRSDAWK